MTPYCPPHYTCTFSPKNPSHYWVHWYDGPWGVVAALVTIAAIALIVGLMTYWWSEDRRHRRDHSERERERTHRLAVEEQRTMQVDACKGNPDMLQLVRKMQL